MLGRTIATGACALILGPSVSIAANPRGANAPTDIPYGVEALAQYRTEYNYRGFILAKDTVDLQLGAQYAFDNTTSIAASTWYGTATGEGDFTEAGFLADLRKDINQWTLSLSGTYRNYTNSFFENGTNIQAAVFYQWNTQFDSSTRIAYDTGAEGWYGDLNSSYYLRLNDESYFQLKAGVSYVSNYYTRNGFNDFFAKLSYTYNINQSLSLSPYLGTSVLLDKNDVGNDSLYGGIYFAVSF